MKAVSFLSKKGIKTNVTLVFSVSQAILAARAGATYISPFLGRLDDIGVNSKDLIGNISKIFEIYDIKTENLKDNYNENENRNVRNNRKIKSKSIKRNKK